MLRALRMMVKRPRLQSMGAAWLVALSAMPVAATQWGADAPVVVQQASPKGVVGLVQQVSVRFAQPAVPAGDPRAPAPYDLTCTGPVPSGQGRWVNPRTWVHDFDAQVPPGVRCVLQGRRPGAANFGFQTGGPAVRRVEPSGGQIEEHQAFLLRLTGVPDLPSVAARAHCLVEGLGERLPVRLILGAEREAVLKARRIPAAEAAQALVLTCQRPLPPDAQVKLVWGAGIAAKAMPEAITRDAQVFDYTVQPIFTAELSCERERADKPCLPVRPLSLRFSAPVPRSWVQQVRLQPPNGAALMPVQPDSVGSTPEALVHELVFAPPFQPDTRYTLSLPQGLVDDAGRPLANAEAFPLSVTTGDMPPLAKFAAAPFGVIELHAEPGQPPLLPVTVRQVEQALPVRSKTLHSAADILTWMRQVRRYHESQLSARELGRPKAEWTEWVTVHEDDGEPQARPRKVQRERWIATRELSLLAGAGGAAGGVKQLQVPRSPPGDPRPFEVVGIPLAGPGYHVVELESPRLGAALLPQAGPMYVRTGVLATNLSVHFKLGRDNALVWVTSLDKGQPVKDAEVAVHDCRGTRLWHGRTDGDGLAHVGSPLAVERSQCTVDDGLFVMARHTLRSGPYQGQTDVAFVFSDWQKGIEPWRFQHPTQSPESDWGHDGVRAHTVFDRSLFRAGETVSMKHFVRIEHRLGLKGVPPAQWPDTLKIVHQGSGTEVTMPLRWEARPQAGLHALSRWTIPQQAQLGVYEVSLEGPVIASSNRPADSGVQDRRSWASGTFRVEEFRVPLVDARLVPPQAVQVAPASLPLSIQLRHLSGGAMQQAAGQVTAIWRERTPRFAEYESFSFESPRRIQPDHTMPGSDGDDNGMDDHEAGLASGGERVLAKAVGVVTDRQGLARVSLASLPDWRQAQRPGEVHAELSFADPNGEVQTVATTVPVWPSNVVLGLTSSRWAGGTGDDASLVRFQVVALSTAGKPLRGQRVAVEARLLQHFSHRKRIVGGFYAYDNRTEVKNLGTVCDGQTDARGLLWCETRLKQAGEVELVARAKDSHQRMAEAATTVWITDQGELWFAQDNDDRMDVLPEQPAYEPGQTARLQVRMPFRQATVLVAVEREGVIDTRVMKLQGDAPVIEVPIPKAGHGDELAQSWAPNVYVSVMALRGRLREVPWYSFFTWGWRSPVEWARAFWYEGRSYKAPTAMVDLSRPAYKLGVAALRIGRAEHTLKVEVRPDKGVYGVRDTARTRIRVTHQGRPVQGSVAFAAVDDGLLALSPNPSWNLLEGLLQERAWGVGTSTANSEVVGRRHYGRKAVAPGGGGGAGATRELLDTLLLWQGDVPLNAQGEAVVDVPINDALTRFRLVAVASSGLQRFGTGQAEIRVTQDLQVLPGLPPLVREGDRFEALVTVRNTTTQARSLTVALSGSTRGDVASGVRTLAPPPQRVTLQPDSAQELRWTVQVPTGATGIAWRASAETTDHGGTPLRDAVTVQQTVEPAVPLRVWQAALVQAPPGADGANAPQPLMRAAPPAGALAAPSSPATALGGVRVSLHASLAGALPGVQRYFEHYPFACLEQKVARGLGLAMTTGDATLWDAVAAQLPSYLDDDGLAAYFPPTGNGLGQGGSDVLTAHLLSVTHQAGHEWPLQARDAMLAGLSAFVRGEIRRELWTPGGRSRGLVNDVRRLAAIDALARHGRAEARWLDTVHIAPQTWPTSALIHWVSILQRLQGVPQQAERLAEAEQLLRSRLIQGGTMLRFATEADDFWWWTMDSPDANAVRLLLAVMDRPDWRDDLPGLLQGALARQRGGAWLTTPANVWGVLAVQGFAARFEATAVKGRSAVTFGDARREWDWASSEATPAPWTLPWPAGAASAAPVALEWRHQGQGRPWVAVQTLAAVPLQAPLHAGYRLHKTITPVDATGQPIQALQPYARGTLMRVTLVLEAQADMNWVAVQDPVPGGATVLGSGLGRDSALASAGERQAAQGAMPVFIERSFSAWRAYFDMLPKGRHVMSYTVRLNNPGRYLLPPSRAEAMYAPDTFAELPNSPVEVAP